MDKKEVEEIIEKYDYETIKLAPVPMSLLMDVLKAFIREPETGLVEDEYGL